MYNSLPNEAVNKLREPVFLRKKNCASNLTPQSAMNASSKPRVFSPFSPKIFKLCS